MWHRVLALIAILVCAMIAQAPAMEGRAASWGSIVGYRPEKARDLKMVTGASIYTVGVRRDGTVVVWGANGAGLCNNVPAGLTGVKAIATGYSHILALREDGTVVAWGGQDQRGFRNIPAVLRDVTTISIGTSHVLALKQDGTVVAEYGEAGARVLSVNRLMDPASAEEFWASMAISPGRFFTRGSANLYGIGY